MNNIKHPGQAINHPAYLEALTALLYQLADDDFILAYRGSEWLGLAPHIEEDVAFSSISQNTMGHAAMFYQMLEELGEGDADELAHGRNPRERKNAILLEEVNGPGTYLFEPHYDWAFTVVRHYFYDMAKKIRLESLKSSSYEPLAQVAVKIHSEQYYHIMHWKTWFEQLIRAGGDARTRMEAAIDKVWEDFAGVLTLGEKGEKMASFQMIESEEVLSQRFYSQLKVVFEQLGIRDRGEAGMKRGNGRLGAHTFDLREALDTLSEVYRSEPKAAW
jgi:ring-1,2-phenylacetyl-CoA epoxidase subunit PaaC